jgi:hypothetical protein
MSHLLEIVSYIPLGDAHRVVLMRERKAIFYVMLVMGEHLCSSYGTSLERRWTHKSIFFSFPILHLPHYVTASSF